MIRRLAVIAAAASLGLLTLPVSPAAGGTTSSISAPDEIIIRSQPFHILSTLNTRFTLQFPAAVTADARVQFLLQRRVANRDSFRAIADRFAEPGVIDSVTIPLRRGVVSGSGVSFDVLMTTSRPSGNDLNMPQPGIYPLTIRAVGPDGAPLASTLTFLDRRDAGVTASASPVSVLGVLQAPVSHSTDGTVAIDDQSRALVRQFVEFLGVTRSPVTLQVQPELVEALATSPEILDNDLFTELRAALAGRSVVTTTYLTIDAAAMVHDGLSGELAAQVRLGETVLARWLPGTTVHRTTWVATRPVDRPTLAALRRMGMKTVILLADAVTAAQRQVQGPVVSRPEGAGPAGPALVPADEQLATTIDNAGNDPVRLGVRIAAEILTGHDDLVAAPDPRRQVRMVVASSTGDILDGPSMSQALSLLATAPGVSVQDLGGETTSTDDSPVIVFPDDAGRTVDGLRNTVRLARTELDAVSSMLPEDEPRRGLWAGSLAAALSPDTESPSEYVDGLRSDLRRLTGSVSLVTPSSIALSSRNGSIRLQIRNDETVPLDVRVRMSSPKVSFTAPGVTRLLPGATTEVAVPIRVRANGRFAVTVRVVTPTGAVQVVSPGVIEVRVSGVAGLGQLVSISLLLVLLAWWWSHWRRSQRRPDGDGTVAPQ